jgi:hypothetical protein
MYVVVLFITCFKTSMYVNLYISPCLVAFHALCVLQWRLLLSVNSSFGSCSWLDLTPSQNNCVRSSSSSIEELNKFQLWVGTCLFWLVRIRSDLGLRETIVGVIWWNPSLVVDQSGIRLLFKLQWAAISEKGELKLFLNRSLPWHLLVPYW